MSDEQNLDALWAGDIERDQLVKDEADLLLPNGTYQTVPALTRTLGSVAEGKNAGRPFARYFGPVVKVKKEGEEGPEVKGTTSFSVSFQKVIKPETGKPDSMYKNWLMACRAYETAAGHPAASKQEVLDFLRDFAVRLRIIRIGVPTEQNPEPDGEPGNFVAAISPVREGK